MKHINTAIILCIICMSMQAQKYQTPSTDWNDTSIYSQAELTQIAINNIDWCYDTPMTTLKNTRQEVISWVMQWMGHHPGLNVSTHADIIKCNNNNLLSMFLCGCAKYNIEHANASEISSIMYGADFMLNFYDKNAATIGPNKQVKKLKKLISNGKWEKKLQKQAGKNS